jgi:hypothetical protein
VNYSPAGCRAHVLENVVNMDVSYSRSNSSAEDEQAAKRREKNKTAAARSRQKKKRQEEDMKVRAEELMEANKV